MILKINIMLITTIEDGLSNSEVEATKIPPEWHAWIHHLIKEIPNKDEFSKYGWQKDHQENKTGTEDAYNPNKYKSQSKADYESWRP